LEQRPRVKAQQQVGRRARVEPRVAQGQAVPLEEAPVQVVQGVQLVQLAAQAVLVAQAVRQVRQVQAVRQVRQVQAVQAVQAVRQKERPAHRLGEGGAELPAERLLAESATAAETEEAAAPAEAVKPAVLVVLR